MRVISLCPSNTEIVEFLGMTNFLVGVDDYSDWPKQINHLPRLGPDLSINMDKVEELAPDLVLASLSVPGMEKNIEELNKRSIPHIVLNPQSLLDIEKDLIITANVMGHPEKGEIAASTFHNQIKRLKQIADGIEKKPTYIGNGGQSPYLPLVKRIGLQK